MVHQTPTRLAPQASQTNAEPSAWQPIDSAPVGERVLVWFTGAGAVVAYRLDEDPGAWVRYLGYGKSQSWPTIHADYATHFMPLPEPPR